MGRAPAWGLRPNSAAAVQKLRFWVVQLVRRAPLDIYLLDVPIAPRPPLLSSMLFREIRNTSALHLSGKWSSLSMLCWDAGLLACMR